MLINGPETGGFGSLRLNKRMSKYPLPYTSWQVSWRILARDSSPELNTGKVKNLRCCQPSIWWRSMIPALLSQWSSRDHWFISLVRETRFYPRAAEKRKARSCERPRDNIRTPYPSDLEHLNVTSGEQWLVTEGLPEIAALWSTSSAMLELEISS